MEEFQRNTCAVLSLFLAATLMCSCGGEGEGSAGASDASDAADVIENSHERGPIVVNVRVSPKEPTIADRIDLELEVTIDEDYEVEMPRFGEKLEQFGIRDFRESQPRLVEGNRLQRIRTYELEPFLSGDYEIPPMPFRFAKKGEKTQSGEGKGEENAKDHVLETEPIQLTVKSLLEDGDPLALELHDIEPPVSLPKPGMAPWIKWAIAGGIALLMVVIALVVFVVRRKRPEKLPPPVPAHEVAFQQLEALVAENLPRKGEIKTFYQRISDILRHYIENRFGLHAPEQTTEEFLEGMRNSPKLPAVHQPSLRGFLQHCDLVKFADHTPDTAEVQHTFDACKNFVLETQSEAVTVPTNTSEQP